MITTGTKLFYGLCAVALAGLVAYAWVSDWDRMGMFVLGSLAAVFALCQGLSYAELGTAYPIAGGEYSMVARVLWCDCVEVSNTTCATPISWKAPRASTIAPTLPLIGIRGGRPARGG